jgi:CDP-diacylglycerol--glycerol-3-phosphate 3-phosphatidyltransferase
VRKALHLKNNSLDKLAIERNCPNAVTLLRLVMAGFVAWPLYQHTTAGMLAAGILLIIAGLTDWLDGYLARRLSQSSLGGSLFDMIADQALFMSSLILAIRAGAFTPANALMPWNPYPYAVPALLGGVFVIAGILSYLWKRRSQAIEFPTPTSIAKLNFWFWLMPLIVAVLGVGPAWLLAVLMYMAIISTIATFYSYLKKGGYVFTGKKA